MGTDRTSAIDAANAKFWDELCGSQIATQFGIKDRSDASLKIFDDAYFSYYPYLLRRVPVAAMAGKTVLEIGLGYGTLGQKIAEHCAYYNGLDIAQGPVDMMNTRLRMLGLAGEARQGNMLHCPFPDESMDCVVSIGCFHHTGNTQRCIDETWRVLKPGGQAYIMVYNRFSLRQWQRWPLRTLSALLGPERSPVSDVQRSAYDTRSDGSGAPETEFFSRRQLKGMFSRFRSLSLAAENCDPISILSYDHLYVRGRALIKSMVIQRGFLLPTVGRLFGLDLYMTATK